MRIGIAPQAEGSIHPNDVIRAWFGDHIHEPSFQ
jgi:hypothetical protein